MSPDERRHMSRLLILRPHPWAYHPCVMADEPATDHSVAVTRARSQADSSHEPAERSWREYLADRVAAVERQIGRLGGVPRDWLF